jgi:hypothetical protein
MYARCDRKGKRAVRLILIALQPRESAQPATTEGRA